MIDDLSDFFSETKPRAVPGPGRGGVRPGAGRPRKRQPAKDDAVDDIPDGSNLSAYQRYEIARADREVEAAERESHLARQAKVKADLDEQSVVDRQSVQDASAKVFAACSQALDAIGDMLEREGFDPELCQRVMEIVNIAKDQLSEDLRRIYESNVAIGQS